MSTLKEFEVSLVRTDPRAGSSSGFHVVVQAPDQTAAKRGAGQDVQHGHRKVGEL